MLHFKICLALSFRFIVISLPQVFGVETKPLLNLSVNQLLYPILKEVQTTFTFRSALLKTNVTIPDPFHWLEAPLETDKDVQQFVQEQTNLTETYIQKCQDSDDVIRSIENAFGYDDYDNMMLYNDPSNLNPFYVYSLKRSNEDRPTWYISSIAEMQLAKQTNLISPPGRKFLIEELLSENSTASIEDAHFSYDGKTFAYLVSERSNDDLVWFFRNIDSPLIQANTRPLGGEGRLPDYVPDSEGDLVWTLDSKGFFYTQSVQSDQDSSGNAGSRVRFHLMGTPYDNDITIVHPLKSAGPRMPQNSWSIEMSSDGNWLIIAGTKGANRKAVTYATYLPGQYVSDSMKWISLFPTYQSTANTLDIVDNTWYFITNQDALNSKVAKGKLDFSKAIVVKSLSELSDTISINDVVPMHPNSKLYVGGVIDQDKMILIYIEKGRYRVALYELKTGAFIQSLLSDESSSIYSVNYPSKSSKEAILLYSGLTSPRKIYEITINGMLVQESLMSVQNIKGTKADDYVTEEWFAISKDGTKVPYYTVSKKGTPKDGTAPAYMHWYGAYGQIEMFYWDQGYFSWLESYAGFFVFVSARGGGDEGETWHQAGEQHLKTNTFDDIIAVAIDLVTRRIAAPGSVIGEGGSAGGLAAAAVANRAPEGTFGAIFVVHGVTDMFLLARSPVGPYQISEFGSVYNPDDFDYIRAYSPLQNIQENRKYPAMLFVQAEFDQRALLAHGSKYIAQVQKSNPNNSLPLLMHLVRSSGHLTGFIDTSTFVNQAFHQHCFAQIALGLQRSSSSGVSTSIPPPAQTNFTPTVYNGNPNPSHAPIFANTPFEPPPFFEFFPTEAFSNFAKQAQNGFQQVSNQFQNGIQGVGNGIQRVGNGFANGFQHVANGFSNGIQGVGNGFVQGVESVGNGIWGGIQSAANGIGGLVSALASSV